MEEKEPNKRDKIIICFIGGLLALAILTSFLNVAIYGRYTVCTITEIVGGGIRGKNARHHFFYKNKEYIFSTSAYKVAKVGGRYLVKFSYKFPSYSSTIQWNYPIPDSIRIEDVPAEGWKKLPEWAVWTQVD